MIKKINTELKKGQFYMDNHGILNVAQFGTFITLFDNNTYYFLDKITIINYNYYSRKEITKIRNRFLVCCWEEPNVQTKN